MKIRFIGDFYAETSCEKKNNMVYCHRMLNICMQMSGSK